MSRQSEWQAKKLAMGLCVQCGTRSIHPDSKRKCYTCLVRIRSAFRKRNGFKPRYVSGRGRPAITRLPLPEQSQFTAA